jgi:hypothetical protein
MQENLFDDDNCEVCKAQRLAMEQGRDATFFELMEAMEKQKKSGVGYVGYGKDLFNL